ncbi:MAG: BACON domain-containing protein, partial [Vicinamibacterales bacterium]
MRSLATAVAVILSVPSVSLLAAMPGRDSSTGSATAMRATAPPAGPRSALDRLSGRAVLAARADAAAQAPVPVMSLDKASLNFGALTSGGSFVKQTGGQALRLSQSGAGTASWTIASSSSWLQVSPASGAGSATVTVSVSPNGVPASGTVNGTLVITYTGATTSTATVDVALRLQPNGTSAGPFGFVDTPAQNATGVIGAIPVTGWAMDDIEVAAVSVCRAPVAGEGAGGDARCGGQPLIYLSDAVFIEGARPDLPVAYPTYPHNGEAGWGTMVLTNFLPGQGNGTYSLSVWVRDVEGASSLLATRTITCDNAHANLPFGTIDTPAQGETISGNEYVNFGWALTQQPKIITKELLASLVYVDGVLLGPTEYGFYRADIATLFPGLRNSDAAVGYRILEPVKLTNGLHTLVWVVTDSGGFVEGLGSRYFRVINSPAATRRESLRAAATASTPPVDVRSVAAVPLDPAPLSGRRGWALNAPWRQLSTDINGRTLMHGEELDRFELQLN